MILDEAQHITFVERSLACPSGWILGSTQLEQDQVRQRDQAQRECANAGELGMVDCLRHGIARGKLDRDSSAQGRGRRSRTAPILGPFMDPIQ